MSIAFLAAALLVVSIVTNLTVQGLKKILDSLKATYSSNVLAVIVSIALSAAISVVYVVYNGIMFDTKVIVQIVVLMYLSFLVSTNGYDKVMQMIQQIHGATGNKQ